MYNHELGKETLSSGKPNATVKVSNGNHDTNGGFSYPFEPVRRATK